MQEVNDNLRMIMDQDDADIAEKLDQLGKKNLEKKGGVRYEELPKEIKKIREVIRYCENVITSLTLIMGIIERSSELSAQLDEINKLSSSVKEKYLQILVDPVISHVKIGDIENQAHDLKDMLDTFQNNFKAKK